MGTIGDKKQAVLLTLLQRFSCLPGFPVTYLELLRIDCWEAENNLKTTPGSDCALNTLAIDEPLEYALLYLDGNMQMWVDAEDSLEL